MGNNKNEIQDAVLYAVIVWNRSLTPGWLNSCIFRFFSFYRKIQRNTKIPEVIDWCKKVNVKQHLLCESLWLIGMWDSEKERKKVSNIFQGRSDIYFVKINLSEINFLLGLGFLNMHVRSLWAQKKFWKKFLTYVMRSNLRGEVLQVTRSS